MKPITLNLIKTNHCFDLDFYSGTIKLKDLFKNYHIPFYEPGQGLDVGFQRRVRFNRIKNIGKRVSDEKTITESFIDCVHLNLRSEGAINFIKPLDEDRAGSFFMFDYLPDFGKFVIIDGQTRVTGAELAYEEAIENNNYNLAEKISNIDVPINLSFNPDRGKEAFNFFMLNYHNAPLPTNGGIALMKSGYEEGSEFFQREIEIQTKSKDIYAYQIAERLNTDSSVWAGEMLDFNETKNSNRKLSLLSFSRMIKPIFIKYFNKSDDIESVKDAVYKVIDAYWTAMMKLYPMMFDDKTKNQFNIRNSTSTEIMMKVLSAFLNDQFQNEVTDDLTNPETYKKFLKNLRNIKDINRANNTVMGQDIFRVGKDGATAKYSSNEGKAQMARNIYLVLFPSKEIVF